MTDSNEVRQYLAEHPDFFVDYPELDREREIVLAKVPWLIPLLCYGMYRMPARETPFHWSNVR